MFRRTRSVKRCDMCSVREHRSTNPLRKLRKEMQKGWNKQAETEHLEDIEKIRNFAPIK